MSETKKRRGPRPRGPFSQKDAAMATRVTADVRHALEAAASRNNRSLSQEVEIRLARSFEPEPHLDELLVRHYGPQGAALIQIIGREMRAQINAGAQRLRASDGTAVHFESDWMGEPTTYALLERACTEILRVLRPAGVPDASGFDPENSARRLLSVIAVDDTRSIADPSRAWGAKLRSLLGLRLSARLKVWWEARRGGEQ